MNQRDQEIEKTILRKIETGEINPFTDFFKEHIYNRFEEINQKILSQNNDYTQAKDKYLECYKQILNLIPEDKKRLLFDMESCGGTIEAETQEVFYKQGFSDGLELKKYISAPSYSKPSPEPVTIDWIDSINIPEELAKKYDSVSIFRMKPLQSHPKITMISQRDNDIFIGFTNDMTPEEMQERIKQVE